MGVRSHCRGSGQAAAASSLLHCVMVCLGSSQPCPMIALSLCLGISPHSQEGCSLDLFLSKTLSSKPLRGIWERAARPEAEGVIFMQVLSGAHHRPAS